MAENKFSDSQENEVMAVNIIDDPQEKKGRARHFTYK